MSSIVKINDTDLQVIEFQGQRVVTLTMVDAVHERSKGTAGRNFREHRARFVEGVDFFIASSDEIRRNNPGAIPDALRRNDVILITEAGYTMLVKPFNDDLAWSVQRQLVNSYFNNRPVAPRIAYAVGARDTLTKAEQDELRTILTEGAERLPLKQRGAFLTRGWSKLKAHFKVSYREIPRREFAEALSIASRHVADLDLPQALPAPATLQPLEQALQSMHLMAGSVADLAATVNALMSERTASARASPRGARKGEAQAGESARASVKTTTPSKEQRTSHVE
ncbi:ORF6N domain-containing protein [Variovorax sp. JS1663]|uniref:ORF6N domain-containing protein n=1 Tax=Variovorax sp. JS1663 TaxID=1851577 RepID=UPI000B343AE7|nr:ORF6N domain-containing protein [Variovorax sp. JS1663]OUM01639.1 hypothetical protein A8M77_15310 [Variovorax sp. JS1663]